MSEISICGLSLEDFLIRMEEFHGSRSPGILLGEMMVDAALRKLGPTPYLNIVTETVVCLPDAVQLLTSCTIGNGFLHVLDWGKFALTSYDRMTLSGVRAWLNPDGLAGYPLIRRWFERSTHLTGKPAFDELASEILAAAAGALVSGQCVSIARSRTRSPCLRDDAPVAVSPIACGLVPPVQLAGAKHTTSSRLQEE